MNAPQASRARDRFGLRRWTLFIAAAATMLGWGGSLVSSDRSDSILLPFSWRDVALVHIACCLPIAWLLRQWLWRNRFAAERLAAADLIIGAVLLAVFRIFFWNEVDVEAPTEVLVGTSVISRAAASLVAAIGLVSLASVLDVAGKLEPPHGELLPQGAHWVCGGLLLLLVPAIYEQARCRSDAITAFEYVEQSRLGEAAGLLRHCLVLKPQAEHQGQEIELSLQAMGATIERVRLQAASPLPQQASEGQRIRRAIQLAVLGQRDRALALLQPICDSKSFAFNGGDELMGTLFQDRRDWKNSRFHFRRAADAWSVVPDSPARQSHLAKSLQGLAFALRKQGEIEPAKAAYRELLQVAPTAETHFLIAQFYEDVQQTDLATQHARRAIELNPEQYAAAGQRLLAKMQANHFRCFQLLRD